MSLLSSAQIKKSKAFIFQNGRLLERKLFEYFFENGTRQACIKVLFAYQNEDGGFGNGIEPDLLCPDSTAIGAETALYVLELLDCYDLEIIDGLVNWIMSNQNEEGVIKHPPENLDDYPHQPWWKNPDDERILAAAGILGKLGIDKSQLFRKARSYYLQTELPVEGNFFGYPYFVYLNYCRDSNEDKAKFDKMIEQLPVILDKHRDHFPLFSRYWFYAKNYVDQGVVAGEAQAFANALQEDGGLEIPYPDLPWWRPIFTLDGLILMKKWSFI